MIVNMKWRDPTVKWGRLDLNFPCKVYRAYGVIDVEGDDFIVHGVFTDDLDDHDRVVCCRVPCGCVISIVEMEGKRKLDIEKCMVELKEKLLAKKEADNSKEGNNDKV